MAFEPGRCPAGMPATEGGLGDAQLLGKLAYGQALILPEFPDVLGQG